MQPFVQRAIVGELFQAGADTGEGLTEFAVGFVHPTRMAELLEHHHPGLDHHHHQDGNDHPGVDGHRAEQETERAKAEPGLLFVDTKLQQAGFTALGLHAGLQKRRGPGDPGETHFIHGAAKAGGNRRGACVIRGRLLIRRCGGRFLSIRAGHGRHAVARHIAAKGGRRIERRQCTIEGGYRLSIQIEGDLASVGGHR